MCFNKHFYHIDNVASNLMKYSRGKKKSHILLAFGTKIVRLNYDVTLQSFCPKIAGGVEQFVRFNTNT